jgi:hypothetical protein
MASEASRTLRSASGPPSRAASTTQWVRWSWSSVSDLREDVDAVLLLLDHPLQSADLALDATQPLEDLVLVVVGEISVLMRLGHDDTIPPYSI